jgi:hypothetical protein
MRLTDFRMPRQFWQFAIVAKFLSTCKFSVDDLESYTGKAYPAGSKLRKFNSHLSMELSPESFAPTGIYKSMENGQQEKSAIDRESPHRLPIAG